MVIYTEPKPPSSAQASTVSEFQQVPRVGPGELVLYARKGLQGLAEHLENLIADPSRFQGVRGAEYARP
jgi:hypothetical protein